MKCKDCNCAKKGFFSSQPEAYVCTGVKEPFVIGDINSECTEYESKRNMKMTREEEYQNALNGYMNLDVHINKALRLIGISAIKKQIPKKVIWEKGEVFAVSKDGKEGYFYYLKCPSCNERVRRWDNHCTECGQALDWSKEDE